MDWFRQDDDQRLLARIRACLIMLRWYFCKILWLQSGISEPSLTRTFISIRIREVLWDSSKCYRRRFVTWWNMYVCRKIDHVSKFWDGSFFRSKILRWLKIGREIESDAKMNRILSYHRIFELNKWAISEF